MYQAPNTDYGTADAWFGAASQNTAATISTSWGESEIVNEAIAEAGIESATYGGIYDEAGLEMAAQGQSAFDASGDSGAYDDVADPRLHRPVGRQPGRQPVGHRGRRHDQSPAQIPLVRSNGEVNATVQHHGPAAWAWDYLWPYYYVFAYTAR